MARGQRLPDNRFPAIFLGREILLDRQNGLGQLSIVKQACALLPELCGYGLSPREGYALAYNCVLLFQTLAGSDTLPSPRAALERFTLSQIADLCRLYWQQDDLPFDAGDFEECGVNESFDSAQTLL